MMLAITMEQAVTKPTVRFGGADLTVAGCASVVIPTKCYLTLLLQDAEHPTFNGPIWNDRQGVHFIQCSIFESVVRPVSLVVRSGSRHQLEAA
jgi:hypothetical protein